LGANHLSFYGHTKQNGVIKTGNGIIETGNGIISSTSGPWIKKLL
jgi:hypothetical protein